jgi:FixJ family two-component response regulator
VLEKAGAGAVPYRYEFLQKPCTTGVLLDAVRRCLDARPAA